MSTFLGILFLLLLLWFWLDSARARELATAICDSACGDRGLQFLDQTVALRRISLRWTGQGIRIRRLYRFDFSEEGVGRRSGHIVMLGTALEEFSLGLPSLPDNVIPIQRAASRRQQR
ncbi:MAG TPA: DUF3301 domain-containing protein [Sedimenticola thiotaurini]|uniref:DUF3301 domain-containing protein n=1 Tax=Sedimenticola thiotaurini TaxID=1543721 RepID=A0A831W4I6_9GAMM|nr:DUF3301 domain-containing protein [Sedimenticola thiotaurini]